MEKNQNSWQKNPLMRIHTDKTLGGKKKDIYFRSFFQEEVVYTCRGLVTNSLNYTWILILLMEHLIKRFFWELLILQNKSKCTFRARTERASSDLHLCAGWVTPRRWATSCTRRVKRWSSWRATKLLWCVTGLGNPPTGSANPRAPPAVTFPLAFLNTEEEAGFVYWHSQLQCLDG